MRVDFPDPDTPVTHVMTPSGIVTSMPFRLLARQPVIRSALPVGAPPPRGHGDLLLPREILPGERRLARQDRFRRARRHHVAAVLPRPRPHVDDEVRGPDRFLVVLHHQHGVPQVAQLGESGQEPPVVALVQPDGRLVQDVEDPHQRRADLGGQPDPLAFPAGQRGRGPGEVEVVEPHVGEERQARPDLLEDPRGDLLLPRGQRERRRRSRAPPRTERAVTASIPFPPTRTHSASFLRRAPPHSAARPVVHVPGKLLPDNLRIGLPGAPLQVVHHPLERLGVGVLPRPLLEEEPDRLPRRPVEDEVPHPFRQLPERHVEREIVLPGERRERLVVEALHPAVPGRDRPLPDRSIRVRHDQLRVEVDGRPQPVAPGAGAVRGC